MCPPAIIAGAQAAGAWLMTAQGMAAATAVATAGSAYAQHQSGVAQAKAQTAYYNQNADSAISDANHRYAIIQSRMLQDKMVASGELLDANTQGLLARHAALTSANERGASGVSVHALIRDAVVQTSRNSGRIQRNLEMQHSASMFELEGVKAQAQNRINSTAPGVRPTGLSLALGFADAAVAGVSTYNQMDAIKSAKLRSIGQG